MLFSGDNLGHYWLCFRNTNPQVLFTGESLPFYVLTSSIENASSHKYAIMNDETTTRANVVIWV